MDKLIKKKKLESERNINKFFENSSTTEKLKITENLIEKLRMNKEFKFTEDFKRKEILNEYGNYDKYFDNYKLVKEKEYNSEDDGESAWQKKYTDLQKKYKNPGTKREWEKDEKSFEERIREDINTYGDQFTFSDYLNEKRKDEQFNKDKISTNPRAKAEEDPLATVKAIERDLKPRQPREIKYDIRTKKEKDSLNRVKLFNQVSKELEKAGFRSPLQEEEQGESEIVGRVSPWCKEEIYKNYLEGWTVKDLSYKYGLLPERVKVIVWFRDLFWREIYPKIGESGLRRRIEGGLEYAKKFAYIDYGKDLKYMALREQGMALRKISRGELDVKPTKEIEEKVSSVLKNIKPRSVDYIPVKFYGKGPSGYLIKDMICKRKLGSKRVSFMFQKFFYYKDLQPNLLPQKVLVRKELGARLATLGYKF